MTDELNYEPVRDPQDLERLGRKFEFGYQRPALISRDLALTSTHDGTVTAEIARRQGDGT
jgi:hypothetical protein